MVQDTDVAIKEVQELFGETVSTYVSWMSEDKKKSWEERKLNAIWHISAMPLNTKWLKLADKVSSIDMISYYVVYQKN